MLFETSPIRSRDVEFVSSVSENALIACAPFASKVATLRMDDRRPGASKNAYDCLAAVRADGATHVAIGMQSAQLLRNCPQLAAFLARRGTITAANDAGVLWQLPVPTTPGAAKIFGIGLNKTGTTSLHAALSGLDFRSIHHANGSAHQAVIAAHRDGLPLLSYLGEVWDAFSDILSLTACFDLADLQYPGSRFILTVRDIDQWIDSRRRQIERSPHSRMALAYAHADFETNRRRWREQWMRHIERVYAWFVGRDDLLILDVCGGDGWVKLVPFLGRAVPAVAFPVEHVDPRGPHAPLLPPATTRRAKPRPGRHVLHRISSRVARVRDGAATGEARSSTCVRGCSRVARRCRSRWIRPRRRARSLAPGPRHCRTIRT